MDVGKKRLNTFIIQIHIKIPYSPKRAAMLLKWPPIPHKQLSARARTRYAPERSAGRPLRPRAPSWP